jgi:phenylacetate-CoA ligase
VSVREGKTDRFLRFKRGKSSRDVDRVLGFLVRSSYRNVLTYRRLLDERRVLPEQIQSVADLPRLPVVDKDELFRGAPVGDRMHVGAKMARSVRTSTSGSTGFPLEICMSRGEALYRRFLLLLSWQRFGRLPTPLRVVDVGSWVRSESGVEIARRTGVSVLRISLALPVERQIEFLVRHRPHVISGYPTALEILADALGARALRAAPAALSPRLVATRGELLCEVARGTIETSFGCRVADFYNCEEVGNIAWQCPRDPKAYHVNTDACIVEIVDRDGSPLPAGTEGHILVTNLYNCTMPFIRYALHDRGVSLPSGRERCACGSRSPRMGVLGGRDDDYIHLPSGRRVSPRLIATAVNRSFDKLSAERGVDRFFRRFQVVQDAVDHLTIRIVPDSDRAAAFEEIIAPALQKLHPELRCTVELVDDLAHEPSGKFKKVIQGMAPTDRGAPSGSAARDG